jgi:enediyne biosynthesis protein E4
MNDPRNYEDGDDSIISTAMVASLAIFAVLAGIGYLAYRWTAAEVPPPPGASDPVVLPRSLSIGHLDLPELKWTDITESAGIDFVHENGAAGEKLLPETMGGGCAFLDYNNNGHQDLLFINSRRWPWDRSGDSPPATMKLYANDGTGNFSDVTEEAGLNVSFYGMGVACGDFDNDGWVDLYITCVGENKLFRNDSGRFVDITKEAKVGGDQDAWSTSAGWFDYDNDGNLDLFVCQYLQWSREYDLGQDFQLLGGGRAYGRPQAFRGTYCSLYRNNNGVFEDVSEEAGLWIANRDTGSPMGKSLGVCFDDFNQDGWLDVIVANDTVQNFLFLNQKDGTFAEIGALAGVAFDQQGNARGAMGIAIERYRNDSSIGVAIGNFSNEMTALYVTPPKQLQFHDEAVANGLGPFTRLQLTFGVFFADIDLDGRLDLFQANGHLEEEIQKVQASQSYEQSPQLFWNAGAAHNLEFLPLPPQQFNADFFRPMVGRGAAYADIDGDGDLDLLMTAVGRKPRLLRNDQELGHHWLRVKLVGNGTTSNRDAIGSLVTVTTAEGRQIRMVSPTKSYLSQVELPLTFGLGSTTSVESVSVRWPDGSTQTIENPPVDRELMIEQE